MKWCIKTDFSSLLEMSTLGPVLRHGQDNLEFVRLKCSVFYFLPGDNGRPKQYIKSAAGSPCVQL